MKKILYGILAIVFLSAISIGALEFFSSYNVSETVNKQAPVQTIQKIVINASAEKVYKIMTDVNDWHSWQTDIEKPVLKGTFKTGNSFSWETGGLNIHSAIHTALPYNKIGWSGRAFGAFAIHNWIFTPTQQGVEVTVEESMESWLVTMMRKKFQTGLEESLKLWLNSLKTEAEKNASEEIKIQRN